MALGIVLTPYGKIPGGFPPAAIDYTYKGATTWMGSLAANEKLGVARGTYDPRLDRQWYQNGEAGYYYDTPLGGTKPGFFSRLRAAVAGKPLGATPTDFQLATRYQYLPVMSGWIKTKQGFQTGPWLPPNGQRDYTGFATELAPLNGLGRGLADAASVEDVMAVMAAHNDRLLALTIVSTTAVAVSALLGVFRTLKLIREDK